MFTQEEIKTAKQIKHEIVKGDEDNLKSILMAGEICMRDELQEEKSRLTKLIEGLVRDHVDSNYKKGTDIDKYWEVYKKENNI